MQRMRTLEELLFQKEALKEKGCRQTAQASLSKGTVVPTPDTATDSFRGHLKGSGQAKQRPCRELQPLVGCAGPVLTGSTLMNTQAALGWVRVQPGRFVRRSSVVTS